MKNLSVEELVENYNRFLLYIDQYITGERQSLLKDLYLEHQERIMLMPASSKDFYHSAYPGGYIVHVMNVIEAALKQMTLWQESGADINFTKEELIFAAINHDLGKIGDEENEMYLPQDSEWHRKNQGALYKMNPLPPFMLVPDRSLFLLQQRGIKVTLNEWLGIRLHDGMYDEGNKPYYLSHSKDSKLRTNLPLILHHADHMASVIEYNEWQVDLVKPKAKIKQSRETKDSDKAELVNVFAQFFEEQK